MNGWVAAYLVGAGVMIVICAASAAYAKSEGVRLVHWALAVVGWPITMLLVIGHLIGESMREPN